MQLRDFALRKCVHLKLFTDTHASLRIELFRHKLSMQEVFEEIAQRIVMGDATYLALIEDIKQKKREKFIKQLSETDAKSIFEIIEMAEMMDQKKPK